MTIANMSIEWGAKAGMIAPDETTFDYVKGRAHAPTGADWDAAVAYWKTLHTDAGRDLRHRGHHRRRRGQPVRHLGHQPGAGRRAGRRRSRHRADFAYADARAAAEKALAYMDLRPGTRLRDIPVDVVFLGSCTNGRLEDLRAAAAVIKGHKVADGVRMLVVPGSAAVRAEAEAEGLHEVFTEAGAEWRFAGCSMCLGMNPDTLAPGQRSASTSNRNFEGRQGRGGRTHLVSPQVAAATAVVGRFAAPADLPTAAPSDPQN